MSWRNFTLGDALDLERMLKLRQTKNVDQRGATGCKDTSLKFLHLLTSPKDRKIGLCRSSMRHRRERKWGRRRFLSRNAAIKEKWSKRASERVRTHFRGQRRQFIYITCRRRRRRRERPRFLQHIQIMDHVPERGGLQCTRGCISSNNGRKR